MAHPSAAKLRRIAKASATTRSPSPLEDSDQNEPHNSITPMSRSISPSPSLSFHPQMATRRLFIASLGNPAPYLNTRHSIGHVALSALVFQFRAPPLRRSAEYGGGSVSTPFDLPQYMFWQSPSMMNVSGTALLKAWRNFVSVNGGSGAGADDSASLGLVILHDELELAVGQVKVKRGSGSARGHNGLKSVQSSLQSAGLLDKLGQNFVKMGIGIGRPVSRDREDVSDYVLAKIDAKEKKALEEVVVGRLGTLLEQETGRVEKRR